MKPTAAQYAQALLEVVAKSAPAEQPYVLDGFCRMLSADNALALWPQIEQEIAEQSAERTATVARASEQTLVADALPGTTVTADPALLGGAVIRRGGRLVDGSLAGQLRRLRQTLAGEQ